MALSLDDGKQRKMGIMSEASYVRLNPAQENMVLSSLSLLKGPMSISDDQVYEL